MDNWYFTWPSHVKEPAETPCSDPSVPVAFSRYPSNFPTAQITAQET